MNFKKVLNDVSKDIRLTKNEIKLFTSLLVQKTFEKREFVLKAGEIARYTYFVNAGCLRVYRADENGSIAILHFAVENHWISDLYSFLTNNPADLNIEALEETEALAINQENMERIYREIPKFERFFRIKHQRAFIAQYRRLMKNISRSAEEKYIQFRKRFPDLEQRIPQKQVAAYMGITPEYLSMLKKRLKD